MEGISSNQNSDQTESYFKVEASLRRVSDDSKNNEGSSSSLKAKVSAEAKEPLNSKSNNPQKRANYSREVTNILTAWLKSHLRFPYPTEEERLQL
mmetsp:Transcript_2035/g.2574  ORF Transcript_2035/g.2574 Transcript_2035/m.2574 type:complete len:95 (+) Transcript_2035:240-524(+)